VAPAKTALLTCQSRIRQSGPRRAVRSRDMVDASVGAAIPHGSATSRQVARGRSDPAIGDATSSKPPVTRYLEVA
jgi:hypothetical protein